MPNQVSYYNLFGSQFEQSILQCPEPELWTTDYDSRGRIYSEMKERVEQQKKIIGIYFRKEFPVLDIGCGFGRQAILLAKNGYAVTGIDSSPVFIDIARKLFTQFGYPGRFFSADILKENVINEKFRQILLLDVLEHIPPGKRYRFLETIYSLAVPETILIISIPRIKKRFLSKMNNRFRRRVTQYIPYFFKREEHPYPIPEQQDISKLTDKFFNARDYFETNDSVFYVLLRKKN
jgi:SAM-dependent methyltransferase